MLYNIYEQIVKYETKELRCGMQTKVDTKQIIANNIEFLLQASAMTRQELCKATDIKYTTLCDWVSARTYPRLDALERVADYYSLEIGELFVDIKNDQALCSRVEQYARRLVKMKDYENTYPEDFFELFGCLSEDELDIPEDLPTEEVEWKL